MTARTRAWLLSLAAAVIAGAASSVTGAVSGAIVAPETFNAGSGLVPLLKLAGAQAVIGAVIGVAGYLKTSPLPRPVDRGPGPGPG